jgi:hypothetical protein
MAGTAASLVAPFMTVVVGIMKVVNSVVGVVAQTPLIDAVVAMIPGLAGQSRVENNFELNRLRDPSLTPPRYFVIRSEFVPPDVPYWQFWNLFRDAKYRLAHWGADFVFNAANDLVVDTDSMADTIQGYRPDEAYFRDYVWTYPQSPRVHHTNYFRQKETAAFFIERLVKAVNARP